VRGSPGNSFLEQTEEFLMVRGSPGPWLPLPRPTLGRALTAAKGKAVIEIWLRGLRAYLTEKSLMGARFTRTSRRVFVSGSLPLPRPTWGRALTAAKGKAAIELWLWGLRAYLTEKSLMGARLTQPVVALWLLRRCRDPHGVALSPAARARRQSSSGSGTQSLARRKVPHWGRDSPSQSSRSG
jgi:hypothetical protein